MNFKKQDCYWFAEVSGDNNPMHLDENYAVSQIYGRVVVHGIHAVIFLFNEWIKTVPFKLIEIYRLDVSFIKAVYLHKEYSLDIRIIDSNLVSLRASSISQGPVLDMKVHFGEATHEAFSRSISSDKMAKDTECDAPLEVGSEFRVLLPSDTKPLLLRYSNLNRIVGQVVQYLLVSTYTVGMVCPGLHSIFSTLRLVPNEFLTNEGNLVSFRVLNVDKRFSRVFLVASGVKIQAFLRPEPTKSLGYTALDSTFKFDQLKGREVLVLGAGRGLGLSVVKALSKSQSKVTAITRRFSEELCELEKNCSTTSQQLLDMKDLKAIDRLPSFSDDLIIINMLTPKIVDDYLQPEEHGKLFRYYYIEIAEALINKLRPAVFFSPSTVFIDSPVRGMELYSATKIEMEKVLMRYDSCKVVVPRLPRIASDQNHSMIKYPSMTLEDGCKIIMESLVDAVNGSRSL
ncbi:MaoC/PaaZ C-terminal domain-containing protein [Gammaproteobacteria bacterium]|nr:MaoC/PaaZ C-terminal domain-containing protein [Gammaproteobacteria bacterium]